MCKTPMSCQPIGTFHSQSRAKFIVADLIAPRYSRSRNLPINIYMDCNECDYKHAQKPHFSAASFSQTILLKFKQLFEPFYWATCI